MYVRDNVTPTQCGRCHREVSTTDELAGYSGRVPALSSNKNENRHKLADENQRFVGLTAPYRMVFQPSMLWYTYRIQLCTYLAYHGTRVRIRVQITLSQND
jgi:hypothetical protein